MARYSSRLLESENNKCIYSPHILNTQYKVVFNLFFLFFFGAGVGGGGGGGLWLANLST